MPRTFQIEIPDEIDIFEPLQLAIPKWPIGNIAFISQGGNNFVVPFTPLPAQRKQAEPTRRVAIYGDYSFIVPTGLPEGAYDFIVNTTGEYVLTCKPSLSTHGTNH